MEKNIAVIKGDGIGPEIVTEAMKVLENIKKNTLLHQKTMLYYLT